MKKEIRMIDGVPFLVNILPASRKGVARAQVRVKGGKGIGARVIAESRGQVLRCATCNRLITKWQEAAGGLCSSC